MTSSAPPRWALGDPAEDPTSGSAPEEPFDLDTEADDPDHPAEAGARFSTSWWTHQLTSDPLTGTIAERRRIRPAVAALVACEPGATVIAGVDALHTALNTSGTGAGVGLSSREWTEVTAAVERATSYLFAVKLATIAGLDAAKLSERPSRAAARDSRRPASDELAPVLRISGRTATSLVGLARQAADLPAAEEALLAGVMTAAQFQVLADICRRLPDGPDGDRARAQVEAQAVKAAATLSRTRLLDALHEAALAADPGFAARSMAAGVEQRDVVLRPSSVPGCQQVVATLETADAARVWQVIQQIAAQAKDGDTYAPDTTADGPEQDHEEELRSLAQRRADVFVSLVVGDFSPTPQIIAEALGQPAPDADGDSDDDDGDDDEDGQDAGSPGQPPVGELAPDTRKPVRIPTPEQRARLSEIHIVVLADDLADLDDPEDPDGPSSDPDDGPRDGPGGEDPPPGPSSPSPPLADTFGTPPSSAPPCPPRERPRSTTAPASPKPTGQPTTAPVPTPPRPRSPQNTQNTQSARAPGAPAPAPISARGAQRLRAARAARSARRALAGYGPFGHVPGIGRLAPHTTRTAVRAARWRRLVADPTTGVLTHRSRWTLPAPDTLPTLTTRSTTQHLALLLAQTAAPDPNDPATRIE
ncbi:hypothetical protein ACUN7V_19365, partial [Quadrisphaera oryzae]